MNNDPRLENLMINQIYVDEVQDLTMAQILPLITICKDIKTGLMFTGDAAQVITRGSVFRFEDLSSMMYKSFKDSNIDMRLKTFTLTRNCKSSFVLSDLPLIILYI